MSREPRVPAKLLPIVRETPNLWIAYYLPKLKKCKTPDDLDTLSREAGVAIADIKFFSPRGLKGMVYGEYLKACDMQKANWEHELTSITSAMQQQAMLEAKLLADEVAELTIKTFDKALKQAKGIDALFAVLYAKQKVLIAKSARASTFTARHPSTATSAEYKNFFAPWHLFQNSGQWTEQEARAAFSQAIFDRILKG